MQLLTGEKLTIHKSDIMNYCHLVINVDIFSKQNTAVLDNIEASHNPFWKILIRVHMGMHY